MNLTCHCPRCGLKINYRPSSVGTLRKCPACGEKFPLPSGPALWPYAAGCLGLIVMACCGFCLLGNFGGRAFAPPAAQPDAGQQAEAPAPPAPPKPDHERIQGEWVDASGEWVWEFAGDEVTVWHMGDGEAHVSEFQLWPAPAQHINLRYPDARFGIYRFDGNRLLLALCGDARRRPRDFAPAEGVDFLALRPLAEAEGEGNGQDGDASASEAREPSPTPIGGTASPPTARQSAPAAGYTKAPPTKFAPAPPSHAEGGPKTVHVPDYTRKDGTHVRAHDRAAPGSGGGRRR
jgi:hypothetical protein